MYISCLIGGANYIFNPLDDIPFIISSFGCSLLMITIRRPDDWHVHFRDGQIMETVVPLHANIFNRCLVMPNVPMIRTDEEAISLKEKILDVDSNFTPVMTLMLEDDTDYKTISNKYYAACKLYPKGIYSFGVSNPKVLGKIYEKMEEEDLVLCIHPEHPKEEILQREIGYLHLIDWISKRFPGLRIVVEHISSKESVKFVQNARYNVVATITVHHLYLTLTNLLGKGLKPHYFCNPVVKNNKDLDCLREAIFEEKFFFGSDSAPHLIQHKEATVCRAGIYVPSEVAMSCLLELGNIENFTSVYGANFYKYPLNIEEISFENVPWTVPESINGIRPFRAGEQCQWRLVKGRLL